VTDALFSADKFTQHNFQEVMEHEEFLLLPLTQLIDIISSGKRIAGHFTRSLPWTRPTTILWCRFC
jgi:hypothetical protein